MYRNPTVAHAPIQTTVGGKEVELRNRSLDLYQSGKLDEAIALFRQAFAIQPDFPEVWSGLGVALETEGKYDEAISDFGRSLKIKPIDAVTENNLGLALFHR
jgi:Flp pilus assembly protein TadD